MISEPLKVLFICTHNRCRSVLFEALTNQLANGRIIAQSAGSSPAGEIHPGTLKHLAAKGIDTSTLRSKSWDECESFSPDLVVTVCDSAAGEMCPVWFGLAQKLHWGLSDPSAVKESEEQDNAFSQTMSEIETRVNRILAELDSAESVEALTANLK